MFHFPTQGIIQDIFTNIPEIFVITDDVFVIIALPDRFARGLAQIG